MGDFVGHFAVQIISLCVLQFIFLVWPNLSVNEFYRWLDSEVQATLCFSELMLHVDTY
jgi:hypothetical protein